MLIMCSFLEIGCKVTTFISHLQIFCAKNEEKCTDTLQLCRIDYPKLHNSHNLCNEIIVVCDNCTNRTLFLMDSYHVAPQNPMDFSAGVLCQQAGHRGREGYLYI